MSSDSTSLKPYLMSSGFGIARGICVHTLIFPLEVVKTHQQSSFDREKSYQVGRRIWRTEGWPGLYRGLPPQLLKASIKQAWVWPLITGIPPSLDRYHIHPLAQQAITGLGIATVDAAVTTPLERAKILTIVSGKRKLLWRDFYKEGWRGFTAHWANLSVKWSAFLVAQKYLRDRYREKTKLKVLTLPHLAHVGVQVAIAVSLVAAPFDIANTLKQGHNRSPRLLFSGNALRKMYRGWPINALSLTIHNIASVILIDKLGESRPKL